MLDDTLVVEEVLGLEVESLEIAVESEIMVVKKMEKIHKQVLLDMVQMKVI